ncbi:NAD(P)/FAD-dependent oxidoreductase [Nisaea nitritireducens]|uniref:NAD(P)/FAD-dependent oxidoreductase n=1 Tax=Nisaea nitritireducens TaxID=568392 RepID=UPI0018692A33|nr:NAD(P)/FAD-dependent oxidoreductase [Nisaea nitritireducens]
MSDLVDAVVIGAGVVGLAAARALAMAGREVIVLEQHDLIGSETSSRHSEVIHAGIYYPPGSLKADVCVRGKEMLYEYVESHGVPYKKLGKLIVATSEDQIPALQQIKERAEQNGVHDLEFLSHNEVTAREPDLRCVTALWSPSTGVIDSHSYMLALQGDLEEHGGMIAFLSPVEGGKVTEAGIELRVGGLHGMTIIAKTVVVAAGLHSQSIMRTIEGFPSDAIPPQHFCKGNYYQLTGCSAPFSSLIYPAPEAAGLGVHLTLDLGGQARFGPDVEWIDEINYDVDPRRSDSFYAAVRKYWPGLPDDSLTPAYSGIRPKIQAEGEPAVDYMIQGPADHGVEGLVNLYGIESPGLTSSLAIAEEVMGRLEP